VLSKEEENIMSQRLVLMGKFGFPLGPKDLRLLVKDYLDSKGLKTRFLRNLPGKEWLYGFIR